MRLELFLLSKHTSAPKSNKAWTNPGVTFSTLPSAIWERTAVAPLGMFEDDFSMASLSALLRSVSEAFMK